MRPGVVRSTVIALLTALACGACAHGRVDDPPLDMELAVTGLKEQERELLRDQLCAFEGISACELQHKKAVTTLRFVYRGSLGELRHKIAQLPHPGLNPEAASARLAYEGFDNLAPTIEPVDPLPDVVLTYKRVTFVVIVKDPDTAEVFFGEKKATRDGDRWHAALELAEGENTVRVLARDEVGNEREHMMRALLDTTPPSLEVAVTPQPNDIVLLTGSVESGGTVQIDGREVPVDMFGKFEVEVRRDPDKRTVTIIAKDKHGNETRQHRSLSDGAVLD